MPRPDCPVALPYVAVLLNAVTWSEAVASQAPVIVGLTLVVQLVTGLAIACVIRPERQALGVAVAVSMPIIGPLATAWVNRTRGRGGTGLLAEPTTQPRHLDGADIARRLVSCPPPCEAIVSGNIDSRRAAIARLAERADADDVAILRWARNQPESEVAVEAALALEDVGHDSDQRIASARDAVASDPCVDNHAALVHAIAGAIVAGVVDAPVVAKLATEARTHYDAAIVLDPASAVALIVPRARLELAADHPVEALAVLESAIATCSDEQIAQLYSEAAYAARRFELVSTIVRQKAAGADG